jgi:hypothetical protein
LQIRTVVHLSEIIYTMTVFFVGLSWLLSAIVALLFAYCLWAFGFALLLLEAML